MAENKKEERKIVAQNRKAYHDYFVEETFEAGIALAGTEVKSIRAGGVNLKDSYCSFEKGEIFAVGIHISPYDHGNIFNLPPLRDRKLLMHRREILKLQGAVGQKGFTVVPLSLYFRGQHAKLEVGLCRGKKMYDKRESDAKRQAARDIDRQMKSNGRDD